MMLIRRIYWENCVIYYSIYKYILYFMLSKCEFIKERSAFGLYTIAIQSDFI